MKIYFKCKNWLYNTSSKNQKSIKIILNTRMENFGWKLIAKLVKSRPIRLFELAKKILYIENIEFEKYILKLYII